MLNKIHRSGKIYIRSNERQPALFVKEVVSNQQILYGILYLYMDCRPSLKVEWEARSILEETHLHMQVRKRLCKTARRVFYVIECHWGRRILTIQKMDCQNSPSPMTLLNILIL